MIATAQLLSIQTCLFSRDDDQIFCCSRDISNAVSSVTRLGLFDRFGAARKKSSSDRCRRMGLEHLLSASAGREDVAVQFDCVASNEDGRDVRRQSAERSGS